MGLKRAFKKVFKPVRKVLDKVIPNEIKPALPYLAAFTPFLAPTTGFMGTMTGRALLSGGANIAAQLAQEGTTEEDLNLLSAGIAAATGALSAPQVSKGITTSPKDFFGMRADLASEGTGILSKAKELGFKGLSKGAGFLSTTEGSGGVGDILRPGGKELALDMASATAVGIPLAQGTGDAMYTDAIIAQKQQIIDDALAEAEALADSGARAQAIRNAMSAYDFFTEQEILDTIASAGYKAGGRVGFRFGGIEEAIESVQEETVEKGKEGIMQAAGEDPLLIEEYNKYVFDLMEQRPNAKPMTFNEFKRMIMSGMKDGGRIGFRDGSSTGSFGLDRYVSEMISEGNMLNKDAVDFLNKYEDIVKEGKADERVFDLLKEYEAIEDKAEKVEDKFSNTKLEDAAEGIMSVEDLKYYDKKIEDLDKKLDDSDKRLDALDKEFYSKNIDASEITRTPDFQEWLELYMSERGSSRTKALNHPKADIYLSILGLNLGGRDKSFYETISEKKDGGLMDLGGKEMDLRGGGFVPIGKKERADDVPARLSKNEFVMTADAVRAAGGGSVNKGAKRMYNLMNTLEARA